MNQTIDQIALAAVARGMPADTTPEAAATMKAAIVEAFTPYFAPPPSSDGGRQRTPFYQLVRQAVRNAGYGSKKRQQRWAHLVDTMAVGSTFAQELCAWAGVDPDELTGNYQ